VKASAYERTVTYITLIAFTIAVIYPLLSILFLALHRKTDLVTGFAWPTNPHLSSFSAAWTEDDGAGGPGFPKLFLNSFIVAGTVTVVSAILSVGTGYAFGTMRFRGERVLFAIILLGIIFPYEATVIPLYYDFQNFGLLNTYWALILPQIGQSVSFGTFWMRAFFRSSPRSLLEAARMDGANSFGVLWRVLVPQAVPALLTLCTLVFVYTWNEFLLALVLIQDTSKYTAPLGLSYFAGAARAGDPTKVAAAAVLVALPIVVVYIALQRHFIRGMLAGAIKE
jgi:raffinose/stachyose/melibiose transport system permease protein